MHTNVRRMKSIEAKTHAPSPPLSSPFPVCYCYDYMFVRIENEKKPSTFAKINHGGSVFVFILQ